MSDDPENRGAAPLPEKAATPSSSKASDTTMQSEGKRPFIPAWLDDAKLSAVTFRLYCHLRRSADNETGIAWPSYERMGKVCGISRATINRCLTELLSRKLIEKADKQYFGSSTRYMILAPIVASEARLSESNSIISGTIEETPIVAPENCNRVSSETPIVAPEAREGNPMKVIQRRNTKSELFEDLPSERRSLDTPSIPFPSVAFSEAWRDWLQHRIEIKKKLTPTSIKQQFRNFAEWGEERSIAAIRHTIGNGWQGIFEPSGQAPAPAAPAGTVIVNGRAFKS